MFGKKEKVKLGYASELLYQLREWYECITVILLEQRTQSDTENHMLDRLRIKVREVTQEILNRIP